MHNFVVAGQVWQAPNGAQSVVVSLDAPEDEDKVYATLIDFYSDGMLAGHQRIDCERLREKARLIYDVTMTMPWRL